MPEVVTIAAVGDLAPLRSITDCQPAVEEVWQSLRNADTALANLEIALTSSNQRVDKAITLKADPSIARSLAEAGLNVVSVANNHACDFGAQGLFDTIAALGQAGVACVGGGADLNAAFVPCIQEIKGLKIAHLGICSALPPGFAAAETRPGIAPLRARSRFYIDSITLDEQPGISPWVETAAVAQDLALACEKVAAAKAQADFVIVQLHWGIPHGWCALFQGPLADYQQPVAHALIEAGADLLLGHHPHTVHGVERYRQGLIVYSLGNFLFHSMAEDHVTVLTTKYPPYNVDSLETGEAREAVLLQMELAGKQIKRVYFKPLAFNSKGEPEFLHGARAEAVLRRLSSHSKKLGTKIDLLPELAELVWDN